MQAEAGIRTTPKDYRPVECRECANASLLDFDFTMAYQPIVNVRSGEIFAYEALVRGLGDLGAAEVFRHVNEDNLYRFDQTCRTKAIKLAAELGVPTYLSINFMPNAVYRPELCIRTTLRAADTYGFPVERIIFEFSERERISDLEHVKSIVRFYQESGFKTAIDDFGAGYAGLNLLAEVKTDFLKLDMALIRDIHKDRARQAIARAVLQVSRDLGYRVVAEGVETRAEVDYLSALGIELFQGFYFARPAYESLASVDSGRLMM